MVKERTTLHAFRKSTLVVLAVTAVLAACLPGQSPEQIQAQVQTSVAMTVESQNQMGTAVALTVQAQLPAATATSSPTPIGLSLPTLTPIIPTVTPFVVVPPSSGGGGGGGSTKAQYACSWTELKPTTNVFSPGDAIDVKWVITNTGTKKWDAGKDLDYVSGTKMSSFLGEELPALKPGDSVTVTFDANAPMQKGLYGMQFKVEGGLCWPALNIQVGGKK